MSKKMGAGIFQRTHWGEKTIYGEVLNAQYQIGENKNEIKLVWSEVVSRVISKEVRDSMSKRKRSEEFRRRHKDPLVWGVSPMQEAKRLGGKSQGHLGKKRNKRRCAVNLETGVEGGERHNLGGWENQFASEKESLFVQIKKPWDLKKEKRKKVKKRGPLKILGAAIKAFPSRDGRGGQVWSIRKKP